MKRMNGRTKRNRKTRTNAINLLSRDNTEPSVQNLALKDLVVPPF